MAVTTARPWHLPLIAMLAILFYLVLAAVYMLTMLQIPSFAALFSETSWLAFTALPDVIDGLWALAVWGGLLGSILLWMESRRTALVLGLAFLCMLGTLGYQLFVANALATVDDEALWLIAGVVLGALAIYVYARQMHVKGYIR